MIGLTVLHYLTVGNKRKIKIFIIYVASFRGYMLDMLGDVKKANFKEFSSLLKEVCKFMNFALLINFISNLINTL